MRVARILLVGSLSAATALTGVVASADVALAAATTRYVAPNGDDGENACTVAAKPCQTVQHAVDVSAAGDVVRLARGTYDGRVAVDHTVTVTGPADSGATVTGDGAGFAVTGEDTLLTLSLLNVSGVSGAGVDVEDGASIVVRNSSLVKNDAGVSSLGGGSITVDRSVVAGNSGGGVLSLGTPTTITDSDVQDNGSDTDEGFSFGVAALGAPVRIERSTVSDNGIGGVIIAGQTIVVGVAAAPAATSSITDSTVSGSGQVGVVAQATTLTIATSTVSGNGSIGVYAQRSAVAVRNSTIAGTRNVRLTGTGAPTAPAGLYYETRTTGDDERAAARAAFLPRSAKLTVGRRTVALQASARRLAAAATGFTVSGTALDQSGSVRDCVGGTVTDAGYNLSADAANSCRFSAAKKDLVKTAARLGVLKDNGGTTATQLPAANSPLLGVIPAGKAGCVTGATDQRGLDRRAGARCDIGAVERALAPVRITTKSLPHGQVGETYRKAFAATGGDGKYLWALAPGSTLPDGLTLSSTGVISGTPRKAGRYEFAVLADDAARGYTLVVDAAAAGPNDNGADPIAETGAPSASLIAWGSALVLAGLVVLLAAGHVGRRPGRHRSAV